MGFSVGRWEGEELVVESAGFNDATWLDFGGHPHTEALRITERYRRVRLRPHPAAHHADRCEGLQQADHDLVGPDAGSRTPSCSNTSARRPRRSAPRSVGPAERRCTLAPEILAKYVGEYDFEGANPFRYPHA